MLEASGSHLATRVAVVLNAVRPQALQEAPPSGMELTARRCAVQIPEPSKLREAAQPSDHRDRISERTCAKPTPVEPPIQALCSRCNDFCGKMIRPISAVPASSGAYLRPKLRKKRHHNK